MAFKFLLGLLSTSAFAATLNTTAFQQSLKAHAPRNYIVNSGAEYNDLGVTDAGGIVSRTTTDELEGDASFAIDASSSGQKAIFTANDFQPGVLGGSCELRFRFNGDATLYKAYATLAGTTVSAEQTLTSVTAPNSQAVSLIFPCGDSATNDPAVVIEATSASAAAIKVDSVYIGQAVSLGAVAQAEYAGMATRSGNQSVASTADTKVQFNSATMAFGTFDTATNYRYTPGKPGNYAVKMNLYLDSLTAGSLVTLSIRKNGAAESQCTVFGRWSQSGTDGVWTTNCVVPNIDADDYLEGYVQSADSAYDVISGTASNIQFTRIPSTSETVLRQDAPGIQLTAYTPTYTAFGTVSVSYARYACLPAGLLYMTGKFTSGTATGSEARLSMPSGFTSISSIPTIMRVGSMARSTSGADNFQTLIEPSTTYITMGTQTGSAAGLSKATGSTLAGSGNELSWEAIVPVSAASPCPTAPQALIPGSEYSSYGGITAGIYADINCDASSAITSQSGGISAVGNRSSSSCALTISTGTFSSTPWSCVVTPRATTVQATSCSCSSATACTIYGANADYDAYIQIKGPR